MVDESSHWTPFETPRLRVTPISLRPDVVQDVFTLRSFEEVNKWSVHPPWQTTAQAEEWIAHKLDFPRTFGYAISLLHAPPTPPPSSQQQQASSTPPTAHTIGTMGIVSSNEIGYQFHPSTWGRGYATEAISALVRHVYSNPALAQVDELQAWIDCENGGSRRVLQKCGFRQGDVRLVDDIKRNYEPAELSYEELQELKHAVKEMKVDMREGQWERPPAPKKVKLEVYVITRADVDEGKKL